MYVLNYLLGLSEKDKSWPFDW